MSAFRGVGAVFRRELGALVDAPATVLAGLAFVVGVHALFFFLGYPVGQLALPGLWVGNEASVQTLFVWIPLLLVLVAPALTMGAFAEERRAGTDELLLTWPLSTRAAVLGKFLAAWCAATVLLFVALFSAALLVATLGPLDWGPVFVGALGAALLSATCIALALLCSAGAQQELAAYVWAALLLGGLWLGTHLVRVLPAEAAAFVHAATPATHFLDGAASGVLLLRDVAYHLSVTVVALYLAGLYVESRRYR